MDEKENIYKVDLQLYYDKINKKCKYCVWEIQCRGPIPYDVKCPHGFTYKRDAPDRGYYG